MNVRKEVDVMAELARDANVLAKEHTDYREAKIAKAQTEDELIAGSAGLMSRKISPSRSSSVRALAIFASR